MNATHERHPLPWFRHYEPNPRRIEALDFVVLCRSIVSFGLVDTLVALEDGRVLGGNQRLDAVIQLGKGFEVPRADGKGKELLRWQPPDGLLDAMVVRDVDEAQAKAINVALNKHAGAFVEDELAKILREVRDARPELLGAIDIDDEIERLLADDEDPPIGDPPKTKGVPSITLQFTSAGAHTRVKQALAEAIKRFPPKKEGEKVPSGDALDELLQALAPPKNGARPGPKKTGARARA